MTPGTNSKALAAGLPRVLGLRDVVLLYAIAVVSLQWLSTAAQIGPSSLALWLLALAIFFVPSGLAVMELSSRYDGEGGLYVWIKHAFGDVHAFIAGWSYVVSNLVFYPTLLLFISGTASYIGAGAWPGLKDSYTFNVVLSLAVLWLSIVANIVGLERAKRVVNGCALVMGSVLVILVVAAIVSACRFGSATTFAGSLMPDVADPALVKSFATMTFALVGLELAPLMGGEIRNPQRVIPRAIVAAGALIIAFYLLGTWALLAALPKEKIEAITGIPEGIAAIADRIGFPALCPLAALLMTIASAGVLAAWVTGTVRLPYVVGVDHHLPRAFGRLHPRWRSPYVALIVSGAITTVLVLLALAGTTIGDAYQILVDMTVTLTFIPIAYMFAALPMLRAKRVGDRSGLLRVPGGWIGVALVSALGLASTLASIGFALSPPSAGQAGMFYLKVLGGCALFLGLGLALYFAGPRSSQAESRGSVEETLGDAANASSPLQMRSGGI
jgi:glutamate:GABA antiporter